MPATAARVMPDLEIGELWGITGRRSWKFLVFREPDSRPLNEKGDLPVNCWRHSVAGGLARVGSDRPARGCRVLPGHRP